MIRYGSVCSGIEAASVAWRGLPFAPRWFSEVAPFPSAVLAHRFPEVPNRGDFTTIDDTDGIDLLVGGTPCQDFSVAGLRAGIAGERGNLTLEFVRLAGRARPRWLLWENVPGVLSVDGGRAFGAFLGGLAELGYGFAYRVLDAQFTGVPQRRRRVFVVGYLGDWRRAAAVLFERHSLSWDSPPRREAGKGTAAFAPASIGGSREGVGTMRANGGDLGGGSETLIGGFFDNAVEHSLRGTGFDASEDGTGRGTPLTPICIKGAAIGREPENGPQYGETLDDGSCYTLTCVDRHGVSEAAGVRRLTPRECERLQGFPDDWTAVPYRGKPASDGPRYEALGNSMAVPCMRWIGKRIAMVEASA